MWIKSEKVIPEIRFLWYLKILFWSQYTGFSIEASTQWLIAAYFEICSSLLCSLFAAFLLPGLSESFEVDQGN